MPDSITVPHLAVGPDLGFTLMRLDSDEYDRRRNQLVDRCYADHEIDVDACPPAWRQNGPLQRWCWLILHVNDIDHNPDEAQPLIHFGIDFGFAPTSMREFIFAIS